MQYEQAQRELQELRDQILIENDNVKALIRLRSARIQEANGLGDHPALANLREEIDVTETRDLLVRIPGGPLQGHNATFFEAPAPANPQAGHHQQQGLAHRNPAAPVDFTHLPTPTPAQARPQQDLAQGNAQLPMRPAAENDFYQAARRAREERERNQHTLTQPALPRPEIIPIQRPPFLFPQQDNPLVRPYPFTNNGFMRNQLSNQTLAAAADDNAGLTRPPQRRPTFPSPTPPPNQPLITPPPRRAGIIDLTGEGDNRPNANRPNQVTVGGNRVA